MGDDDDSYMATLILRLPQGKARDLLGSTSCAFYAAADESGVIWDEVRATAERVRLERLDAEQRPHPPIGLTRFRAYEMAENGPLDPIHGVDPGTLDEMNRLVAACQRYVELDREWQAARLFDPDEHGAKL